MQSTVIFIDWKCIETPIKLTIFLKEKVKIEGLIPNRSTGEKCSLYLPSGRPVVPLWEIREDLGRLPTQLKAHLKSTYICLAIQLGFCCCFFSCPHDFSAFVQCASLSTCFPYQKEAGISQYLRLANLCPPTPGPMSTIVMGKQSEL